MESLPSMRHLGDTVDGAILFPGQPGYDESRTVWNAMVDRRPRLIYRCASVRDVVSAVRTARELELDIGIRCGGHSVVGHAVPDDGLMLDLRPMGGVQVDPRRRLARVEGGAMLGALDREAQRFGLATTAGNVSHTGVGGLTLGGGMGWLARKYGLSCDNVVSFEVVTAEGRVLRASATEHPDLYWGLRGGGGNFGVVTEFEMRLHPVGTKALITEIDFPVEQAVTVLRGWRELNASVARQATLTAFIGTELITVGYVWVGDPEAGQQFLPVMRELGRSAGERVSATSYLDLQTRDDTIDGHEMRRYWKGHYFRAFSDDTIEALVGAVGHGGFQPNISLQAYGGAIGDVADDDTAFSHRDTMFEFMAATGWTDPAEDEMRMAGTRATAAALDGFASGAYVNALSDEGAGGVGRAYSVRKLARLTAVKDSYDPENAFHLNHNIVPSCAGRAAGEVVGHT